MDKRGILHDFLNAVNQSSKAARGSCLYGALLAFQIVVFIVYLWFVFGILSTRTLVTVNSNTRILCLIGGYFLFLLFLFLLTRLCRLRQFKWMTWGMVYLLCAIVLVFISHILMGYFYGEFLDMYIIASFSVLSGIPFLFFILNDEFLALPLLKRVMLAGIAALAVAIVVAFYAPVFLILFNDLMDLMKRGARDIEGIPVPMMISLERPLFFYEAACLWSIPLSLFLSVLFLFGKFFNQCKCKRCIYFVLFFLLCWSALLIGYPVSLAMAWISLQP